MYALERYHLVIMNWNHNQFLHYILSTGGFKSGPDNVRPAGHMRPSKKLNVSREHFLGSLRILFLRKCTPKVNLNLNF